MPGKNGEYTSGKYCNVVWLRYMMWVGDMRNRRSKDLPINISPDSALIHIGTPKRAYVDHLVIVCW